MFRRTSCILALISTYWSFVSCSNEEHVVIFRSGCCEDTALNVTESKNITANYPGTCLDFCRSSGKSPTLIALQDKLCKCVSNVTRIEGAGCNTTCPGHGSHFCGNEPARVSSLYTIDYNTTVRSNNTSLSDYSSMCVSFNCNGGIFLFEDCRNVHKVICSPNIDSSDNCSVPKISSTGDYFNGSWKDAVNTCFRASDSNQHMNTSQHSFQYVCGKSCLENTHSALDTFWIGGFGQRSPPFPCSPNATTLARDNNGFVKNEYTVYFNCSGTNTLLRCFENGSWPGAIPRCSVSSTTTTTHATVSQSLSSTTTTTHATVSQSPSTLSATHVPPPTATQPPPSPVIPTTGSPQANTSTTPTNVPSTSKLFPLGIIIGVCAALLLIICIIILICVFWMKKKKQRTVSPENNQPDANQPTKETENGIPSDKEYVDTNMSNVATSKLPPIAMITNDETSNSLSNSKDPFASTSMTYGRLPPLGTQFMTLITPNENDKEHIDTSKDPMQKKQKKKKKKKRKKKKREIDNIDQQTEQVLTEGDGEKADGRHHVIEEHTGINYNYSYESDGDTRENVFYD